MIHYHGGPIWPDRAALHVWDGHHGMVSYARRDQTALLAGAARSFTLDNGAFTLWRKGTPTDWPGYYAWAGELLRHPACDWAVIPDVIDGGAADNDALLAEWPHGKLNGVPVWHLDERLERLERLAADWPRVALGSAGEFAKIGTARWWNRMRQTMEAVTDADGAPLVRLHGLRMLDPAIVGRIPFTSADSSYVGTLIAYDKRWTGVMARAPKPVKAWTLARTIEAQRSPERWEREAIQDNLPMAGVSA